MTVFFSSDLHLGHESVEKRREVLVRQSWGQGARDGQRHDGVLLDNFRLTLTKRDQLWVLGDISNGSTGAQRAALEQLTQLRADTGAEFHLIPGNHDGCHPQHRTAKKWWPEYLEVFDTIMPFANRKIADKHTTLSHYPYVGEHGDEGSEDRHPQWRLPDLGRWGLHGHSHQAFPLSKLSPRWGKPLFRECRLDEWLKLEFSPRDTPAWAWQHPGEDRRCRQINVGVDAWGLWPVSLDVIARIIQGAEEDTLVPEDLEWIGGRG